MPMQFWARLMIKIALTARDIPVKLFMRAKLVARNQCAQHFVLLVVFIVTKVMNLSSYILKGTLDVTVAIQNLKERSSKDSVNSENQYNHNFDGLYCICERPYPDPDDTTNDEMLQCIICEDWYHSKHLECEKEMPADGAYDEMICAGCMRKNDFLWNYATKYAAFTGTEVSSGDKEDESIDVENQSKVCTLPQSNSAVKMSSRKSCFWIEGWRAALCTCESCKELYRNKHIMFLLDPSDSVHAYEEAGKINRRESQYEKGMKALASLGHVEQLTAIEEYNIMKERLKQYLQKFAENKKVVREEDIKEFFSEMESKKRPKVVIPTYCR
ncbi:unnamed protein product [Xylocopa violacea]|uniref:E3 ubiquitin-protein ligase UBR7 n=1 Tax=Xylocopa violacea TaxID=135666 RepID=A0ABP1NSV6_XYLVO